MKYLNKKFSVPQNLKRDIFLEDKKSPCCNAKIIRIAGSFRCSKCDKYYYMHIPPSKR